MHAPCLAFAEPGHGSDLASIETRGDTVGNEVVVTGRKTWIADADNASVALVLCVTEPAAPRYENLSCVLVPLADDGVELRPICAMSGDSTLFDARFDGARAPLEHIVGGRGNGWRVATATLRSTQCDHVRECEREFWELVDTARRCQRDRDPLVRQQLAWAYSQVKIMRALVERHAPGDDSLVTHVLWSEYHRRLGEIAVEVMGSHSLVRPDGEAYATNRWQHVFLASRADTIASGTTEVQRTIIAERLLGLPR
jgi:alkylation response protein AidB-like acyl-CoA dehydrogenase